MTQKKCKGRVTQKVFIEILEKPPFLYMNAQVENIGMLGAVAVKCSFYIFLILQSRLQNFTSEFTYSDAQKYYVLVNFKYWRHVTF